MKNIHLVVADLFLPSDFAGEVGAGLSLPALERLLARGRKACLPAASMESWLCGEFGMTGTPVAAISAAFDGLEAGIWLRADPVHLRLQRDQVVMLPHVDLSRDEAIELCASLNAHFLGQGMAFFAPEPLRWYLRLEALPDIETWPLSQAAGRNIHGHLPRGTDARYWHSIFNEIQMLLFSHPLNAAREARGEMPVNSLWLWGQGEGTGVQPRYEQVSSDEVLAEMLATAAGCPFTPWADRWQAADGSQLLVWTGLRAALQRGDLAAWREALQEFETGYVKPLWQALRRGEIAELQFSVLGGDAVRSYRLTRGDAWSFWRRSRPLAAYS